MFILPKQNIFFIVSTKRILKARLYEHKESFPNNRKKLKTVRN